MQVLRKVYNTIYQAKQKSMCGMAWYCSVVESFNVHCRCVRVLKFTIHILRIHTLTCRGMASTCVKWFKYSKNCELMSHVSFR